MASTDEIYRIIMQVEGESLVDSLRQKIEIEERSLAGLINALKAAGNAHFAMDAGVRAAGTNLQTLNAQLKAAENQAKAFGGMSGSMANKMQVFGQTLDDLQYVPEMGLRPILNNLMQMSPVIGTVVLAGSLLYTHWDKLMGLFGSGKTESEAEEMKRLGDMTRRTADEEERYQQLRRSEAAGKRQREARPEAEERATKAVGEAITEGDREGLIKGLVALEERSNPRITADRAQAESKIADLEKVIPIDDEDAANIRRRIDFWKEQLTNLGGSTRARAEKFLADAEANPAEQGAALAGLVNANPDLFPAGTGESLDLAAQGISPSDVAGIRHKGIVDKEKRETDAQNALKKSELDDAVAMMKIAEAETKDKKREREKMDRVLEKQSEEQGKISEKGAEEHEKRLDKEDDLLIRSMLGEDKKQRKRTSEVFGIESFADKIQSAVGGDRDPNLVELKAIKDLMKQQLEENRRRGQPGAVLRK